MRLVKMNPKYKKKWVKALRSGEYKQTTGGLCKEVEDGSRGYCCLGVLADVTGTRWHEPVGSPYHLLQTASGESAYLWLKRRVKVGLDEHAQYKLTIMNDAHKWSFKRIADWIEKHL